MDESFDLKLRIKQFLSIQPQFRDPNFDPAPFLINILKEKSADREGLIQRQNDLIERQNQCIDLVDDICSENYQEFLTLIETPKQYYKNLAEIKTKVEDVKREVKEAKIRLISTQKDIKQVHYNCMFNKIVYKKLKEIELRLIQYETAYTALKNNQFLLCSFNLPNIEDGSILQSALASRAQSLRLRMITKAIDQVNLFIFMTPKVIFPSTTAYFQRISVILEQETIIGNWQQHEGFYKRYKLFKKIDWKDYLSKIWSFEDLDRKQGKLGKMHDILKSVTNVGRLQEITSSIEINGKKQVGNLFILLKYFRMKDSENSKQSIPNRWFLDYCTYNQIGKKYIAGIMCLVGVLIRKNLIIQKLYQDFSINHYRFQSAVLYDLILDQLKKLIEMIYFPEDAVTSGDGLSDGNSEMMFQECLRKNMLEIQNYATFGYSGYVIRKSLKLIEQHTISVSEKYFEGEDKTSQIKGKGAELFMTYHKKFYQYFHKDFCAALKEIFQGDGRVFLTESFEAIAAEKQFNEDEIKYMKGYRSDSRKAIKQYVFSISLLKALEQFFNDNHLQKQKFYKYVLFLMVLFYLKLNYHFNHNILNVGEALVINEQRKNDKKLRKKEEEFTKIYYKFALDKQVQDEILKKEKKVGSSEKEKQNSMNSLIGILSGMNSEKNVNIGMQSFIKSVMNLGLLDKVKIFKKQNQMLLSFSTHYFHYLEAEKKQMEVIEYFEQITRLQPANYEQNIEGKMIRIWDSLPNSQKSIKQFTAACLHKLVNLACGFNTKIYRQSGYY